MKCIIGRIMIILGTLGSAYMFYYMVNDTISNYVSPLSKREVVVVLSLITFLVLLFAGFFISLSCAAQKDEKSTSYNVGIQDREIIKIDNKDDKPSFRGDLSMCADDRNKIILSENNLKYNEDVNVDSSDAVIFLSFTNVRRVGWICSECGAANSNKLSNCAVCGLQK